MPGTADRDVAVYLAICQPPSFSHAVRLLVAFSNFRLILGKGGKNRRRGKGDGEENKRELEFKEDGRFWTKLFRDNLKPQISAESFVFPCP